MGALGEGKGQGKSEARENAGLECVYMARGSVVLGSRRS